MKILALETSSVACSVALLDEDKVKIRHEIIPMQHAKRILAFIDEVLDGDLSSLDLIAWGCGPGSFTGLRIGASVVQSLGFARQLPIVSVSSLAALAQTAYEEHGWQTLGVAVDARMQEVYFGYYCVNNQGNAELVGKERISSPQAIPPFAGEIYAVGNAWSVYKDALIGGLASPPLEIDSDCLPKALAVARLGRIKYERGEWLRPLDALPVYLRDNVA